MVLYKNEADICIIFYMGLFGKRAIFVVLLFSIHYCSFFRSWDIAMLLNFTCSGMLKGNLG